MCQGSFNWIDQSYNRFDTEFDTEWYLLTGRDIIPKTRLQTRKLFFVCALQMEHQMMLLNKKIWNDICAQVANCLCTHERFDLVFLVK